MIKIKSDFKKKIYETAEHAIGVHSILLNAIYHHNKHVEKYPDGKCRIGIGCQNNPERQVKYAPSHMAVQSYLSNNTEIIMELFLTQIVQFWFDFLLKIYEKIIEESINNEKTHKLNLKNIKLNLSQEPIDINNQIIFSALRNFDFLPADDKFKEVFDVLGLDSSTFTMERNLLKENIKVRNILQHSSGFISKKDLDDLGVSFIGEDHGLSIKKRIEGEKVTRTAYDIEKLADVLLVFADALIP